VTVDPRRRLELEGHLCRSASRNYSRGYAPTPSPSLALSFVREMRRTSGNCSLEQYLHRGPASGHRCVFCGQ
jgi:hypothetical protein